MPSNLRTKAYYSKTSLVGTALALPEQLLHIVKERPEAGSTIILAGSSRSGTTWLADILTSGTKTQQIFEPLHPYWIPEVRDLAGWTKELRRMRLLYLRPNDKNFVWEDLLTRVLSGEVRSWGWTDNKRTSYLPERYLIKFIRANLMLGYLYNTFNSPIIYIVRHPCAVTLSRLKTKSHCDVKDLLEQEALVEDYLKPWVTKIEGVSDRLDAMAIWWSVENMIALDQIQDIPHLFLTYESLILDPHEQISKVAEFLGLPLSTHGNDVFQQPSRTSRGAVYSSSMERLAAWQKKLTYEEQQRILYWAHCFGIDIYDQSPLPIEAQNPLAVKREF